MMLVLTVAAFYAARKGNWPAAGVCAGLVSGVRITGVLVGPALLVEYLHQRGWRWREIKPDVAWLALAPAGLVAYMVYLAIAFSDPLDFYHHQYDFPRLETVRTQGGLLHFIPSLIDELRVIFISHSFSEQVQNTGGAMAVGVFIVIFALMLWLRLRPSYTAFAALAGFSPLLIGRLDSMSRYIIVAFPIFLVLGMVTERWPQLKLPLVVVFLALFYLLAVRFATYNWAG
jgi:Gpi18-like mannosyltransferase